MAEKPLDLEQHEEETRWDVWRRRLMFALLIALCVAFAAPTFGACSGVLGSGGHEVVGTYRVAGADRTLYEGDFRAVFTRYLSTKGILEGGYAEKQDAEEQTRDVWRHILLDEIAVAEGIHVPDSEVAEAIHSIPYFQHAGEFSEDHYRAFLRDHTQGALGHKEFSATIREMLRVARYHSMYALALGLQPAEEVYDTWRKRNLKITTAYAVQPYESIRAEVAAVAPTDEELRRVENLPPVKDMLRTPARKKVEAAFARLRDLSAEQVQAMEKFVAELGVTSEESPLPALAFGEFHSGRTRIYTRENWIAWRRPEYERLKAEHDKALAEWEATPEEGRGPKPEAPKDPAAEEWPNVAREEFDRYWRETVTAEVLAREVLRHFAERAEREGKAFSELVPEYSRFGIRVVANEEFMTGEELAKQFPERLGQDTELEQVVWSQLKGPAEGAPFKPQVHPQPVPTTRLTDRLDDRGFMVLRLAAFDAPRILTIEEARDKVVDFWRKHRVGEIAKERLEALKARVEAASAEAPAREAELEKGAAEAGMQFGRLRRFNRDTRQPQPPEPTPGQELSPELADAAKKVRWRNRVQQDYAALLATEAGKFREPPLLDEKADAGFLALVVEKYEPAPIEMTAAELRTGRMIGQQEVRRKMEKLLGYEEVARRTDLVRHDLKAKEEKAD